MCNFMLCLVRPHVTALGSTDSESVRLRRSVLAPLLNVPLCVRAGVGTSRRYSRMRMRWFTLARMVVA